MRLDTLTSGNRKQKRIGRGGKRGSFSGRGIKGQKSRAGRKIRPAVRDLIMRIPKKRGYHNKPKSAKPDTLNVGDIEKMNVDIINRSTFPNTKILGDGEITKPVTIDGVPVSKSAREKILKANGKIS